MVERGADAIGGDARSGRRLVLLVEDDNDIREIITEELVEDGLEVMSMRSGEEFRERFASVEVTPEALIVDIHLGGIDGFQVARLARERWHELVVITISGDLRPLVRSSGPRDLSLFKPFTAETLRQVLRAARL